MPPVSVALARESEAPACLALLRDLRRGPAEFLIARRGVQLAGAAAVVWRDRRDDDGGFPLVVQVTPAFRRQGVGRRLVEAAAALVRGESVGLCSDGALEEGSEAAAFALACGFQPTVRIHDFRAEVGRVVAYAAPLVARLRARGHVPQAARIVPLDEAPLDEVAWLVSAQFGGGPQGAEALLRDGRLAEPARSVAVMDGERVAGVVLGRWDADGPAVEGAIVAPGWRRGWANAVLVEAIAALGVRSGAAEFRFRCRDDALDTMQLAARIGAVPERTGAVYARAVAA
jgi:GNAT superfamily N-acetyltransferase